LTRPDHLEPAPVQQVDRVRPYAAVGTRFPITAELLCEAVDLCSGEQVLGADGAASLRAEMTETVRSFDISDDNTLVLPMDHLEVVVRKPQ
jgi:hypothetical protein